MKTNKISVYYKTLAALLIGVMIFMFSAAQGQQVYGESKDYMAFSKDAGQMGLGTLFFVEPQGGETPGTPLPVYCFNAHWDFPKGQEIKSGPYEKITLTSDNLENFLDQSDEIKAKRAYKGAKLYDAIAKVLYLGSSEQGKELKQKHNLNDNEFSIAIQNALWNLTDGEEITTTRRKNTPEVASAVEEILDYVKNNEAVPKNMIITMYKYRGEGKFQNLLSAVVEQPTEPEKPTDPEQPPTEPGQPTNPNPEQPPTEPKPEQPTNPNPEQPPTEPGTPEEPVVPVTPPVPPTIPVTPAPPVPAIPSVPVTPVVPEKPVIPPVPEKPVTPTVPERPITPGTPVVPEKPVDPPTTPAQPTGPNIEHPNKAVYVAATPNQGKETVKRPNTGDKSKLWLYGLLASGAIVLIGTLLGLKRKK